MNPRRTPLEQKLGTFIRMLASERDGEVRAAERAIVRTLKAAGADIHVLAERVETENGSKLTDADAEALRRRHYAGVRAAESKQHDLAARTAPVTGDTPSMDSEGDRMIPRLPLRGPPHAHQLY